MRLLHTSDWHLGRTLHGEPLLEYQAAFLRWLLDQATEHHVHAVIVAGDVYDRAVPPVDAVALLDRALQEFATARVPVVLIAGNHDSAVRLGFGSRLSELAGVHLRTSVADVARPVVLSDEHGEVAIYGIGYLLPDAVMDDLGAERSHASVLAAAAGLIRADAASRGIARTVVAAHAFVTGALASESERDIRIGGIADVPASVFAGLSYVALGHLHGQQKVPAKAAGAVIRYSGSPLAFSFSERHHAKSVTLAEIDGSGKVTTTLLPVPVPRPLAEIRGRLADLLSSDERPELAGAWLRVVLTDQARPVAPMERLRAKWPHTLVLDFEPEEGLGCRASEPRQVARTADPVQICAGFVEFAGGSAPSAAQVAVLTDVVEVATQAEAAEGAGWRREPAPSAGADEPVISTRPSDVTEPGELDRAGSIEDWLDGAGRNDDDWLVEGGLPFADHGPPAREDGPAVGPRRRASGRKRRKPAA